MLVMLETNVRMFRTSLGHGTVKDMTMDNIWRCVRSVRFIVLCSAFLDPDDLIFNAKRTMNERIAKRTVITMNATEPPDPAHCSHCPPATGAKFGAHVEHRKFSLALLYPTAHRSVQLEQVAGSAPRRLQSGQSAGS